jgi:hypothetical protein
MEAAMSDETPEVDETPESENAPPEAPEAAETEEVEDRWEFWAQGSLVLFGLMVVAWGLVFARLGIFSVQIHAMVIPTIGALTLALLAWGLIRALFKPPAFRRSRTIAFVALLITGWVGNRPLIAPPLATDDWTSTHRYLLPFDGTWATLAGGRAKATNYNATSAAIRYAYDFAKVVDGEKFKLDGARNEDFYGFGEPVYAPTSGKVMEAVSDVVDNTPGEVDPANVFGNHVVIKAGESEYVFVWHLQHGSVTVKAGDEVTPATVIGKCGNSGRSLEPHVKVHAQDRLDFPIAMGLPIEFSDYDVVHGKRTSKGMPYGSSEYGALDGLFVSNVAERQ